MTIDLDALEKLADEATPGPWMISLHGGPWTASCRISTKRGSPNGDIANVLHGLGSRTKDETRSNAAFIAAANPATIKALIAELKEANGLLSDIAASKITSDNPYLWKWASEVLTKTRAFLARNGRGEGQ